MNRRDIFKSALLLPLAMIPRRKTNAETDYPKIRLRHTFDDTVQSMVAFQDKMYIATTHEVYEIISKD